VASDKRLRWQVRGTRSTSTRASSRLRGSPAGSAPRALLGHRDIALGLEAHAPLMAWPSGRIADATCTPLPLRRSAGVWCHGQ